MHDFRYAFRLIRQNWAFSLTVILILALCIGANTAVLSVVNAAMVRPLPYPDPARLGAVVSIFRQEVDNSHDGRTWEMIRDHAPSIDAAVYSDWASGVNMGVNGSGIYVKQQRVSTGFFRLLGIAPQIGREFNQDEDRAGGPPAVLLSHALWTKHFSSDPGIVGRTILLRGEPYTVVGVMPASFQSDVSADLWNPIKPSRDGEGGGTNYGIVARLKPGSNWAEASTQLNALVPELKRLGSYRKDAQIKLDFISLQQSLTQDLREPLMILWAAVAAVFVLGCVNIGGMLLARASGRIGEIATRLALGAPLSRIVRQLLIESIVLGLCGGAAGVVVGWVGLAGLRALGARSFAFLTLVDLDWRVLITTLALTLVAGLGFGLVPAWQASRVDLRSAQTGSRTVAGRKRFISLGTLVGGQVALTVPLLIGAGLLMHTFLYLWNMNSGFDGNHVLTAQFSLQDARYSTAQKMNELYDQVLTKLRETPGIESAAASLSLPYERGLNNGVQLPGQENMKTTDLDYVTPEFFTTLRIPLLQGRGFTRADGVASDNSSAPTPNRSGGAGSNAIAASSRVAIVNKAFADRYLKGQSVLGQPISFGGKPMEIVGVVGDVIEKRAGWGNFGPIAAIPTAYIPAAETNDGFLQLIHTWFSPNWIVRSSLPDSQVMAAIESATRSVDPMLPMAQFRSVNDLKIESLTLQRFLAALVNVLAILAALLTTLGIYGLIANLVAERTKELGIRMALGSTAAGAVGIALRPALKWVLAGVAVGSAASFGLERFLQSFLWGVRPGDPLTLIAIAAGLLVATAIASLAPASRIVRLNPADTLRSE
jgi:predicted permease